ncbi:methyl-accepting chemotaxis protein [uncultured Cohaesibacter sp.]|uniref:methyl-accepting chemotaxis protein n=1 Tax=uncultured Cohaesibacter sp. TaxID=1002546 RepID=UPI0029C931A4|nr:methyl-accepting chemotaxis protein [uncultured Cohaesibacter sp.]
MGDYQLAVSDNLGAQAGSPSGAGLLSRFKIGQRIYGGFLAQILLMVILSAMCVLAFRDQAEKFSLYSDMASDASLVESLSSEVVRTRLAQKSYFETSADAEKAAFAGQYQTVSDLMKEAKVAIQNPERVSHLKTIDEALSVYKSGVDEVSSLIDRRNVLVYDQLGPIGLKMQENLTLIRSGAFTAGDFESASFAGTAQEHLLLARLYVMKFLDDSGRESMQRANDELLAFDKALAELKASLSNPDRRKLLADTEGLTKDYEKSAVELEKVITNRNAILKGKLNKSTDTIFSSTEATAASAEKDDLAMREAFNANLAKAETNLLIVSSIALLVGALFAYVITRGITRPVNDLTASMGRLARDDVQSEIPGQGRKDELGMMAAAVEFFRQKIIKGKELEAEQVEMKRRSEEEKRKIMMQMADEFERQVGSIVQAVSSNSVELNASAQSMTDVSRLTLEQATQAASSSQQTTSSVQTIATATEEMTSTIAEISHQVAIASQSATEAVTKVRTTNEQMATLLDSASRIGNVVEMISTIAEQTNLLALNATIESARAGEAGKGFAVVAGEVKALAGQTARATEEIVKQISEVQAATKQSSDSMNDVSQVIQHLNEISAAIAAAMEEQNVAINEVASNIHQAAQGSELVNQNIFEVNKASQEAGSASSQVLASSQELSEQAEMLRSEVDKFIDQVRAG